jgi:hypothetical protein
VSDGTQGSLSPLQLIHCVNQLSVTVFKKKKLRKQLIKRKVYFGSQFQRFQFMISWPIALGLRRHIVAGAHDESTTAHLKARM